jgi:hypothetical protein
VPSYVRNRHYRPTRLSREETILHVCRCKNVAEHFMLSPRPHGNFTYHINTHLKPPPCHAFEYVLLRGENFYNASSIATGVVRLAQNFSNAFFVMLHNLYTSPNIIRMVKSRELSWDGNVARMGEMRNSYKILVGKT